MKNLSVQLFCLSVILALALSAPAEDEVHIVIPEYTEHKWYSGKFSSLYQAIYNS